MRSWVLVLLAGCYKPDPLACNVRCDDTLACPPGLTCAAAGGLCRGEQPCGTPIDDGAVPDVSAACAAGEVLLGSGQGLLRLCLDPILLALPLQITAGFDTGTACPLALAHLTNGMCVIAGTDIDIMSDVRFFGDRSLVIAATGTLRIASGAELSVASTETGASSEIVGAGATDPVTTDCAANTGQNSLDGGGGGGGAGGRFVGAAGDGGASLAAIGGPAAGNDQAFAFRAGCRGGTGGSSGSANGGNGGHPGGAVYLLAERIELQGFAAINASGAGGAEAPLKTGGSGGGSGGFIGLDAATQITIASSAALFALGGGGGAGGGFQEPGTSGDHAGVPEDPAIPVSATEPCDGDGGAGSTVIAGGAAGAMAIQDTQCGGGGGGGGNGLIMYRAGDLINESSRFAPTLREMP